MAGGPGRREQKPVSMGARPSWRTLRGEPLRQPRRPHPPSEGRWAPCGGAARRQGTELGRHGGPRPGRHRGTPPGVGTARLLPDVELPSSRCIQRRCRLAGNIGMCRASMPHLCREGSLSGRELLGVWRATLATAQRVPVSQVGKRDMWTHVRGARAGFCPPCRCVCPAWGLGTFPATAQPAK